jgi:hypothetical protein
LGRTYLRASFWRVHVGLDAVRFAWTQAIRALTLLLNGVRFADWEVDQRKSEGTKSVGTVRLKAFESSDTTVDAFRNAPVAWIETFAGLRYEQRPQGG